MPIEERPGSSGTPIFSPSSLASTSSVILDAATWLTVDKARLARHIRHALQDRAQVTLAALVAAQPLEQGLAELIAYLQLGSDAFTTTLDEATPEPIEWQASAADGSTITRRARLPRVIFMR